MHGRLAAGWILLFSISCFQILAGSVQLYNIPSHPTRPRDSDPVSRKFHNGTSSSRRISCCLPNEYSADPAENLKTPRPPHMYHTPTHRSQTGPLSAGYGIVSDMATYNGYTYFVLDTSKYGPRGVVEQQKRQTHVRLRGGTADSRAHAQGDYSCSSTCI